MANAVPVSVAESNLKQPSAPKPVRPRVILEIAPELEKVFVIKVDFGKETLTEFPYEKLGRELEFKSALVVQVRTYWDEIVAKVKTINPKKKVD